MGIDSDVCLIYESIPSTVNATQSKKMQINRCPRVIVVPFIQWLCHCVVIGLYGKIS